MGHLYVRLSGVLAQLAHKDTGALRRWGQHPVPPGLAAHAAAGQSRHHVGRGQRCLCDSRRRQMAGALCG